VKRNTAASAEAKKSGGTLVFSKAEWEGSSDVLAQNVLLSSGYQHYPVPAAPSRRRTTLLRRLSLSLTRLPFDFCTGTVCTQSNDCYRDSSRAIGSHSRRLYPFLDISSHGLTCVTSLMLPLPHAIASVHINLRKMHFQASSSSLSSESQMTPRAFCVPGVVFLLAATVLLVITSVSLPYLPAIDFVRSHVESGNVAVANGQGVVTSSSISQLRVSSLVSDASGWSLTAGRLHSLDCGLTVPSNHPPEIVIAVRLDMLTPSVFETAAQTTRSPSRLVGLEAWRFTQLVRHKKGHICGSCAGPLTRYSPQLPSCRSLLSSSLSPPTLRSPSSLPSHRSSPPPSPSSHSLSISPSSRSSRVGSEV